MEDVQYSPSATILAITSIGYDDNQYQNFTATDVGRMYRELEQLKTRHAEVIRIMDSTEAWVVENAEDLDGLLDGLCEVLEISPEKEITFTGTISFEGTVTIPLSKVNSFDLNDIDISVTSSDGYNSYRDMDVSIDGWNIDNIEEA